VGPRTRLDGSGKSRPTGIRFPDRPARSKSNTEEEEDDEDKDDDDDDNDDDDNDDNNNNNNNNTIKAVVLQINTST